MDLTLYLSFLDDVVSNLDWNSLFVALFVVISAIFIGLYCSYTFQSKKFRRTCNRVSQRPPHSRDASNAKCSHSSYQLSDRCVSFWTYNAAGKFRRDCFNYLFRHGNKHRRCGQQDLVKKLDFLRCSVFALRDGVAGCQFGSQYIATKATGASVS